MQVAMTAGTSDPHLKHLLRECAGPSRIGWDSQHSDLFFALHSQSQLNRADYVPISVMLKVAAGPSRTFAFRKQYTRYQVVRPDGEHWPLGEYTYTITLLRSKPAPVEGSPALPIANPAPLPRFKTRQSCIALLQNDVCFLFKRTQQVLFAEKAALIAASPYYRDLLEGGFAESSNALDVSLPSWAATLQASISKVFGKHQTSGVSVPGGDGANSDDEDGQACPIPTSNQALSTRDRISYITIGHHSIRTYHAVLQYIESGEVRFAALQSRRSGASASWISASPKSIYALAHEVGLERLQGLAVADFKRQLNAGNLIKELFSHVCFTYPVMKEAALDVARSVWSQARAVVFLEEVDKLGEDSDDPRQFLKMQTALHRAVDGVRSA